MRADAARSGSWRPRLRNSAADSVPLIFNRMPFIVATHQDWRNLTRPVRAATNHTRVNGHAQRYQTAMPDVTVQLPDLASYDALLSTDTISPNQDAAA